MAISCKQMPVRLIVQRGPGGRNWSVFAEDEPDQGCVGFTVSNAIHRWLSLNRDRFPGRYGIQLDEQSSTLDRRVVLLTATSICPECDGSGRYVGLMLVEDCKTCEGSGRITLTTTR